MTAVLLPEGKQSFQDAAGVPLVGGKVFTYASTTLVPKTTWSDAAQTAPNTNPIILDGRGEASIYWQGAYKVQLQDALGNVIWTQDPVTSLSSSNAVLDNYSVDTGLVNAYVMASATPLDAYVAGLRVAIKIATTNTGASTLNYMGLGAKSILLQNGSALVGGELQAGGLYTLDYDGVAFQLLGPTLQPQQIRNAAEIAAGVTPSSFWIHRYKDVPVERYGVVTGAGGDPTANAAAINRAIRVAAAVSNTGGVVLMPQGTIRVLANVIAVTANAVNIQGSGKAQTFLQAIGAAADQPILSLLGNAGAREEVFVRGFTLASDNNLARGINAQYFINSAFDDLFFYQLKNGIVTDTCYGAGFRNNNAYLVTDDCYRLGIATNNTTFSKCRMVGLTGISIASELSGLVIQGCDFEGILAGGAGIIITPATTRQVHGVVIEGNYFENINGTAIYVSGVDASSVLGLVVQGNYITGGFTNYGLANAINAMVLNNVNGFVIEANEFEDWQLRGFNLPTPATVINGRVRNNTSSRNVVANLSSATFDKSVEVANNWAGPTAIYLPTTLEFALTYGVAVASDASLGKTQIVTANNGVAFTMSNPTNGYAGQQVTWRIKNTSGGALGVVTWAATFHLGAAWGSPATGFNRSITFEYDGANWIELYRTSADVAN